MTLARTLEAALTDDVLERIQALHNIGVKHDPADEFGHFTELRKALIAALTPHLESAERERERLETATNDAGALLTKALSTIARLEDELSQVLRSAVEREVDHEMAKVTAAKITSGDLVSADIELVNKREEIQALTARVQALEYQANMDAEQATLDGIIVSNARKRVQALEAERTAVIAEADRILADARPLLDDTEGAARLQVGRRSAARKIRNVLLPPAPLAAEEKPPVLTAEYLIAKAAPLKGCRYHVPGCPAECVECAEVHAEGARGRGAEMTDKTRGLYDKFKRIERTDGKSEPGEKHDGCEYFVLDLTHDKFAFAALRAYAKSCRAEFPKLADDLDWRIALNSPYFTGHRE